MELIAVFNDRERGELLSPAGRELIHGTDPSEGVIRRILAEGEGQGDYMDELMHIDVQTWLPNDVLLKADKMSMAHGLEARVPFLDHEFAEFCAGVPANLKIRRGKEKYILRKAMDGYVPAEIVSRRKHGFTVPLTDWLSDDESTGPLAAILTDTCTVAHLFDKERVRALLRRDISNEFVRRQIFCLKMLQDWSSVFLDVPQEAS
jgi:asparagine synthase (glutamine-hydrolysing)